MSRLPDDLRRLLDHFEQHIDPAHIQRVHARHRAALSGATIAPPPLTCYVPYGANAFAPYPVREILADPAKMLVNELLVGFTSLYHALARRDDTPLVIRPNLGTGVIASMFGAAIEVLDDNPPWARPLADEAAIEAVCAAPLPAVTSGLGGRMFAHYRFFHEALADYPRCAAAINITLPDLQGPFDTAEILWGSKIYVALRRRPELVHRLLDTVTRQIVRVWQAALPYVRDALLPAGNFQHAVGVGGRLLLRNDSIVLVSPAMYREHIRAFDARLVAECDAAIHFCGDGAHQVDNLLEIPGLRGLDFGQAHLMDIDDLYARAAARGVPVARVRLPREQLLGGAAARFERYANLCYEARDAADADALSAAYYRHAALTHE